MIDALIFDLDDTLYPECEFVASGYLAVAGHIQMKYGRPKEEVFDAMMSVFRTNGRDKVFPMVLDRFLDSSVEMGELVDVYRLHTPVLRLFPGYERLLARFHREFKLGVITDGLPEVQRRKAEALNLQSMVDRIIYTREFGKDLEKPHPFCFNLMLDSLLTTASRSVFVGDNPEKDCIGAHSVGMAFVRVLPDSRLREPYCDVEEAPEFVIRSLTELPQVLESSESYATV